MDRITKSLLDEFVKNQGLEKLLESEAFEHFTGFLLTSKHHSENFDTGDLHVGAGGDCGIDSISIIVNGCLVNEPEEVEDLEETNGYLDVTLIFVQAETSSAFDTSKIGQFAFGVKDFMSEKAQLPQNEMVKHKSKIISEIFKRSGKFKKGNPQCFLYYATTGKWVGDKALETRLAAETNDLNGLKIFRKVAFECIDAERLQNLYRENKNAISREIVFSYRTVLPDIPGVTEAYIGLLEIDEFLKLIETEEGEIITSIFYDNVRHWQEWNPVNQGIKATLEEEVKQVYFPLLNNGITIVARNIISTGNRFVLEDYQIVNGCQTSFVIHETKDSIKAKFQVPVRIISTKESELRNSIIIATNRQTQVTEDQLFALSDFPKKLESYLPSFEGNKKLFYERRSKQYNADEDVEKVRVVSMTTIVRSFASIFLELPHRTTRNYKALLRGVGTDIFHKDHRLEMYYLAAYAHYKLEYLFRIQAIPSSLKPARYHILMAFRHLANKNQLPRFNSHDMVRYCSPITDILWDEEISKTYFQEAARIVELVAEGNLHRDNIRTEPFTENVLEYLQEINEK